MPRSCWDINGLATTQVNIFVILCHDCFSVNDKPVLPPFCMALKTETVARINPQSALLYGRAGQRELENTPKDDDLLDYGRSLFFP
jgi:hypothetical protein